jgi:hypothetical protein
MKLFIFRSELWPTFSAITLDQTGANLPSNLAPWTASGNSAVPAETATIPQMMAASLGHDGYYLVEAESEVGASPNVQLSGETYDRAKRLAASIFDQLSGASPGIVGAVSALQIATVRLLYLIDPSGGVVGSFVDDLQRGFRQMQEEHSLPRAVRH